MTAFGDFLDAVREGRGKPWSATLIVGSRTSRPERLAASILIVAAAENGVRLVLDGREVGVVDREAASRLKMTRSLYGDPNLGVVKMRCPVDDARYYVVNPGANERTECPDHPGKELEP